MINHPVITLIICYKLGVMARAGNIASTMQKNIVVTVKHTLTILGYIRAEKILRAPIDNLISTIVTLTARTVRTKQIIIAIATMDICSLHLITSNLNRLRTGLDGESICAEFYTIDTKAITILSLNIVEEIGDLYKAGKTIGEIMEWAEKEVDKFAVYFFADDLKFFKASGRVSGLAGTMGTLLGIRPIIHISEEGKMVNIGKEKGRAKALNRIISYVEELGEDLEKHRVIVAHTDAPEMVEEAVRILKEKFGDSLWIEIVDVNPTAGSHCGPSTVGICFHAKHR